MGCGSSVAATEPQPAVATAEVVPREPRRPAPPSGNPDREFDFLYKILLIGDSGVGKTSIIQRFAFDTFDSVMPATIGVDFRIKTITQDSYKIKTQLWDTAGQERYFSITKAYFRGAQGYIIVYDVGNPETYYNIPKWLQKIDENASETRDRYMIMIIGNKTDLERKVSREEAEVFAEEHGCMYIEGSAKTAENVREAFAKLIQRIRDMAEGGSTPVMYRAN